MKEPIFLAAGAGETLRAAGTQTTFKVKSDQTSGRFSLAEYNLPAGFGGPPPHVHRKFEHAWYILEGQIQIQLNEQTVTAGQGAFIFVPAGAVHTFSNPGDAPARMLAIDTPGGLEPYYEELAAALQSATTVDRQAVARIQQRYDTFPDRADINEK